MQRQKQLFQFFLISCFKACAMFIAFMCNLFVTSVSAKSFFGTVQAANITLFEAVVLKTNFIIKNQITNRNLIRATILTLNMAR